jgi:beta-lactamase class C
LELCLIHSTISNRLAWSQSDSDTDGDVQVDRREFASGLFASLFAGGPLPEASEIVARATSASWLTPSEINAAVLDVSYRGKREAKAFGVAGSVDRVFNISSITKPFVATAAMILRDRGALALQDPIARFVPEYRGEGRDAVTIQNLLTHTAGLPDNVPQLRELRTHESSLAEIFQITCKLPLLFKPGTAISYSNLGVLLMKVAMERITTLSLEKLLKTEIFDPLSMNATSLGLGGRRPESTDQPQVFNRADDPYPQHREIGTPWGGIYSTAADLARFLLYFAAPGRFPIKADTVREMRQDHCAGLNQPWGIGWMLANSHDVYYGVRPTWRRYGWPALYSNPERGPAFGSKCSAGTFGHYGVSGVLAWADPQRELSMVLLTTRPVRYSRDGILGEVSDVVSGM